jgi:hypothetical protein
LRDDDTWEKALRKVAEYRDPPDAFIFAAFLAVVVGELGNPELS